ncbi:MAG: methyltransferase domain-containing protein [Oscillibacter sp.]
MSLFCCPLCGEKLERGDGAYRCAAGHCYDIAKEGYTYLLPVNQKHSAAPGDDKGMAAARRAFLSKDYYRPLLDALCALALTHTGNSPALLDSGCGEGYYTAGIYQALLAAGKRPRAAGIDISKFILRSAAKRERAIEFAVASSYHLPVAAGSVDLLLNCFSPMAEEEFRRVLRPGGTLLYVVPAAKHLWELKEILYDRPYPNEEKEIPYTGFTGEAVVPVEASITLERPADIQNLFQMTPYYWKTPQSGTERLAGLETLTTRISFRIHVFHRD